MATKRKGAAIAGAPTFEAGGPAELKVDEIWDINEGIQDLIRSRGAKTVDELRQQLADCCLQACDCCLQVS